MPPLTAMLLLCEVAEAGSFSGAARNAGITPSAVSRQMDRLEDHFGATLLHRSTRQISLTEAGRVLLTHALKLQATLGDASAAMELWNAKPQGQLRLSAPTGLGALLLAPLLGEFRRLHPEVEVITTLDDRVQRLDDHGIDVSLRVGERWRETNREDLRTRVLARGHCLMVASPDYVRSAPPLHSPEDLHHHEILTFRTGSAPVRWLFAERTTGKQRWVELTPSLRLGSGTAVLEAARSGAGIALMPPWYIAEAVRQEQLLPLLRRYDPDPHGTPISVLYRNAGAASPKVRCFIDFLLGKADVFRSHLRAPEPQRPMASSPAAPNSG